MEVAGLARLVAETLHPLVTTLLDIPHVKAVVGPVGVCVEREASQLFMVASTPSAAEVLTALQCQLQPEAERRPLVIVEHTLGCPDADDVYDACEFVLPAPCTQGTLVADSAEACARRLHALCSRVLRAAVCYVGDKEFCVHVPEGGLQGVGEGETYMYIRPSVRADSDLILDHLKRLWGWSPAMFPTSYTYLDMSLLTADPNAINPTADALCPALRIF